jgi:polyferredoxin
LVKYSTQNAVNQHWSRAQTLRHVLRPRVLVYTFILLTVVAAMLVSLALRSPFKVNVVRDRGTLARIVQGGKIENVYRLQIMNATEQDQDFEVNATGVAGISTQLDTPVVAVGSTQARWVAVRVQVPFEALPAGSHPIQFEVANVAKDMSVAEKSVFIVPR